MDINGPGGDWQGSKQPPGQTPCGKWAIEKTKLDNARKLQGVYFIDPTDKQFKETILKRTEKVEVPVPAAMPCKSRGRECRRLVALFARQNTHASLKPTNLRESVWKGLHTKIMKITLHEKEQINWTITILCANIFRCLKQWIHQMRKLQWIKNGESYQHGTCRKSETKKGWSMKQGKKEKRYTLRRWWTSVISRIRSWNQSFRNTKAELYSEVTL